MAEYDLIERNKIFEKVTELYRYSKGDMHIAYRELLDYILDMPTADVQPVIHAKWILFDRDSVGRAFYCSNCRKVTTTDDFEDTPLDRDEYFCMRCGADMRSPDATKG